MIASIMDSVCILDLMVASKLLDCYSSKPAQVEVSTDHLPCGESGLELDLNANGSVLSAIASA